MPFRSQQQRRFMYAVHPRIAKRWEKETPKGKKLPDKKEQAEMDEKKKKRKKGTPAHLRWDYLTHGVSNSAFYEPPDVAGDGGEVGDGGMGEAVDLRQLRDPMGFVNGVDSFIQGARADLQTLQHFADTYAQSQKADPKTKQVASGIKISLPNVSRALDMLERGLDQLKTKQVGQPGQRPQQAGLPGVKGAEPAQRGTSPGFLGKLFGTKKAA